MKDSTATIESILERFRFREPVPSETRKLAISNRSRALVLALIAVGEYGFFYSMAVKVFFMSRRIGVRLSIAQSKILLAGALALTVFSSTAGAYFAYSMMSTRNGAAVLIRFQPDAPCVLTIPNIFSAFSSSAQSGVHTSPSSKSPELAPPEAINYRLGIADFTSDTVEASVIRRIADCLHRSLVRQKGEERIIKLNCARGKVANHVLLGSVEHLGETYILSCRIVSVEKGIVVYATSEEANGIAGIEDACDALVDRLALKVR